MPCRKWQVASGKCQCEWQQQNVANFTSLVAASYLRIFSSCHNKPAATAAAAATGLCGGASAPGLRACHLNELNEELINHAHILHSYATQLQPATNQSPQLFVRSLSPAIHSCIRPSINQSIAAALHLTSKRKCFCQNICGPLLASALKYYIRVSVLLMVMIDVLLESLMHSALLWALVQHSEDLLLMSAEIGVIFRVTSLSWQSCHWILSTLCLEIVLDLDTLLLILLTLLLLLSVGIVTSVPNILLLL